MPVRNLTQWTRLIFGLAAVFALFHWAALALGSDRGQAGLIVGAIVLSATLAVERIAFGGGDDHSHRRERRAHREIKTLRSQRSRR